MDGRKEGRIGWKMAGWMSRWKEGKKEGREGRRKEGRIRLPGY